MKRWFDGSKESLYSYISFFVIYQEQRQRELREHSKREQQLLEAKAEEKVEVAQQKEAVVKKYVAILNSKCS